jgi:predicted metal-binding protein
MKQDVGHMQHVDHAQVLELIQDSGFSAVGRFDVAGLELRTEVRDMCAADKCHAYGKSWMCPPACGSLEHYQQLFGRYQAGYLFQTVAEMEDAFDYLAIDGASKLHAQRLSKLSQLLAGYGDDALLLGAGACTICESCSYPDEPCRFPEQAFVSMEATGLLVYDVCKLTELPYYHGPNTVAFCSCVLL